MEKKNPAECMFCLIGVGEKFKLKPTRVIKNESALYEKIEIEFEDEKAGAEGGMYNAKDKRTGKRVWFYPPLLCIKHKDN